MILQALTFGEYAIAFFLFAMLATGFSIYIWYQIKRFKKRKNNE
jgi:hypothetical protein